ncbi:MAG: immune inhibitor A [Pleurocapsa minor GSE-CHR-MK-17-07R]|nr:immune inhibitor A [Pleurocapsa minor GSE-CHR-MK 17-07R]
MKRLFSLLLAGLLLAPAAFAQDGLNDADVCALLADADADALVAALLAEPVPFRDRVQLAEALEGYVDAGIPVQPPDHKAGDIDTFYVIDSDSNETRAVDATLRVVGEYIYLWVQTSDSDAISDSDLLSLADRFDRRVYDRTRALWGSEANPGVDNDPRIHGLFTSELGFSAAAYFSSDNSVPAGIAPAGNAREMFLFSLDALGDLDSVESIIAHEFQHMIRFNERPSTELWLNEGFSEFTQWYLYDDEAWFAADFLEYGADTQLNAWSLASDFRGFNYGASLLFLWYLYGQFGLEAVQAIADAPPDMRAEDAVMLATGMSFEDLYSRWILANTVFEATDDPAYQYVNVDGRIRPQYAEPTGNNGVRGLVGSVSQFAAQSWELTDLDGVKSLDILLEAPADAALISDGGTNQTRFMLAARADQAFTSLTRAFDLSGVTQATLDYRMYYALEENWDYGYVLASADGGVTWDVLESASMTTVDPHNVTYGPGYNGASGGWIDQQVDLSPYAGGTVLVRFAVVNDDGVNDEGLAIDDVRIDALGYSEDFEDECSGWDAQGWGLVENYTRQSAVVHVSAFTRTGVISASYPVESVDSPLMVLDESFTLPEGTGRVVITLGAMARGTTIPMAFSLTAAPS